GNCPSTGCGADLCPCWRGSLGPMEPSASLSGSATVGDPGSTRPARSGAMERTALDCGCIAGGICCKYDLRNICRGFAGRIEMGTAGGLSLHIVFPDGADRGDCAAAGVLDGRGDCSGGHLRVCCVGLSSDCQHA